MRTALVAWLVTGNLAFVFDLLYETHVPNYNDTQVSSIVGAYSLIALLAAIALTLFMAVESYNDRLE